MKNFIFTVHKIEPNSCLISYGNKAVLILPQEGTGKVALSCNRKGK